MDKNNASNRGGCGRPPKINTVTDCVMVRFTEKEHVRFLTMFERSGVVAKGIYQGMDVRQAIPDHQNRRGNDALRRQIDAISRLVPCHRDKLQPDRKQLHINFSMKNTLNSLDKLEELTAELAGTGWRVIQLSKSFVEDGSQGRDRKQTTIQITEFSKTRLYCPYPQNVKSLSI